MTHADEAVINPSANPTLADVLSTRVTRRMVLGGGLAAAATSFLLASPARRLAAFTATPVAARSPAPLGPAAAGDGLLGFDPVAIPMAADGTAAPVDEVLVPAGYSARVLVSWGDPILGAGPVFRQDASNSAADQERQWGSHNDGMHFFPLERGASPVRRGVLVANHEYTDEMLLHVEGVTPWTAEKVRKSQAAHGVAVVEVRRTGDGGWRIQAPSPYARRITASTPCEITGPARGHDLMKTRLNPPGTTVLGTFNNCADGHTPWGTYLTCEENFNNYFVHADDPAANDKTSLAGRYGIGAEPEYRWFEFDPRFDAKANPNEPNRFGWVVEIDPLDPTTHPAKRTALGRLKHEGAAVTEALDGRVVVYMGDDQAHEYIYKFVGSAPWKVLRAQGKDPLDHGTLYVARLGAGAATGDHRGTGEWVALTTGTPGLESFGGQAEILINARTAADQVGATKMDRPEWTAVHPATGEVYCTLTNNSSRTVTDDANPRKANVYGQIIRWREAGGDAGAATFEWDLFVLAGDPTKPASVADPPAAVDDEDRFGSPDGLWFDPDGRLWILTDVSASNLARPAYDRMRNNQMLCADPATGELRRFLIGPVNCEITGITGTPDRRTLFVGIQHPGESPTEESDPADPTRYSSWPDGPGTAGRPRSSVVMITRDDGGVVGT
jgi:hypothetical protein